MNRVQRLVIGVAAAVLILMALFPPWETTLFVAPLAGVDSRPSATRDRELFESISHPFSPAVTYRFLLPWPTPSSIVDSSGSRTTATYSLAWSVLTRNVAVLLVLAGAVFFILMPGRPKRS